MGGLESHPLLMGKGGWRGVCTSAADGVHGAVTSVQSHHVMWCVINGTDVSWDIIWSKLGNIPKERFDAILGDISIQSELLNYKRKSNGPIATICM